MNRFIAMAAGIAVLAGLGFWYYGQTLSRQRSAEEVRAAVAAVLADHNARYDSLNYVREANSVVATNIRWSATSPDGAPRSIKIARAEIVAGDKAAFDKVFQPQSYAPDQARLSEFLKLAAAVDLSGVEISAAAHTCAVARIRVDVPRFRQFGFTPSIRGIDGADPSFLIGDIAGAMRFQGLRVESVRIRDRDREIFNLATFELGPVDSGHVKRLALGRASYSGDSLSTAVEAFSLSDLAMGAWFKALRDGKITFAGDNPAIALGSNWSPTFNDVRMKGLKVGSGAAAETPDFAVAQASLTDLVHVGDFVAAGNLTLTGLELPLRGDRPWVEALRGMGYRTVKLNIVSRSHYDAEKAISETSEFYVEMEDAGRLFGSSKLENVRFGEELRQAGLHAIVSASGFQKLLTTWKLARLEVGYKDLSLIERAFEQAIERTGKTREQLVQDYVDQLAGLKARYEGDPFIARLSDQFEKFLREPGTIVFRVVPPEPVVLSQIALAGLDNPADLALRYGITVEANADVPQAHTAP